MKAEPYRWTGQGNGGFDAYAEVRRFMGRLDGTRASSLSLLTGLSLEEIDDLGGLPDEA